MYVYIFFLFFGVGGKCGGGGGGGQNDGGEILLSAPPLLACVLTVATALRRIRSAVGESAMRLHIITFSSITRGLTGRQTSHLTPTLHVRGSKRRPGLH